jgi:hypothetical protein
MTCSRGLRYVDQPVMRLNVALLLLVSFLPFPALTASG